MKYKKIMNLLGNMSNKPSKFRIRNCVEINDESGGTYNFSNQIRFKSSNLCDYSNAYIHVKGTMRVPNIGTVAAPNNRIKKLIFKNSVSFTNCISEMNNTQVDDAHDIDVEMPMCNLIE